MNAAVKLSGLFIACTLALGTTASSAQTQGKTREQVRQELVQARHDGAIPVNKTKYPPSPEQISENKARHNTSVHKGEAAASVDHHDQIASIYCY